MENILTDHPIYFVYLAIFGISVSLLLLFVLLRYKKTLHTLRSSIKEKDEKIKYLRQTHAEYEYNKIEGDHRHEKEIIALNHTIEQLELKLSQGTKNQVVTKIEALQAQRDKQRKYAGLEK